MSDGSDDDVWSGNERFFVLVLCVRVRPGDWRWPVELTCMCVYCVYVLDDLLIS